MSTVKERIDEILTRPMTRQQFLKQAGLLALAMVGITNIINTLDPKRSGKVSDSTGPAYGASVYAGGKKPI